MWKKEDRRRKEEVFRGSWGAFGSMVKEGRAKERRLDLWHTGRAHTPVAPPSEGYTSNRGRDAGQDHGPALAGPEKNLHPPRPTTAAKLREHFCRIDKGVPSQEKVTDDMRVKMKSETNRMKAPSGEKQRRRK